MVSLRGVMMTPDDTDRPITNTRQRPTFMTAQFSEHLLLRGEKLSLCTEPLAEYLATGGNRIKFDAEWTACWRGYVGTWAIEGGRLYLVKLKGTSNTGAGLINRTLADLFPDYPDGVFAHWYTGELRCTKGQLLKYVHGGYASRYEQDQFIDVVRGMVVAERLVVNGVAEPDPSGKPAPIELDLEDL
jgi:hypothetical protein